MNNTTIQAIETSYKGYRFRSRLEARWAVAFDHLKIPWTYEPEGYQLPGGGRYLPDFEIKMKDDVLHVEVKGDLEGTDWEKLWEFASLQDLMVLGDIPEPMAGQPPALFPVLEAASGNRDLHWVFFLSNGNISGIPGYTKGCPRFVGKRLLATESLQVSAAYKAARSARFEHGETPRAAATPQPTIRQIPVLAVGNKVLHSAFGIGSVVATFGEGNKASADIDFGKTDGVKRLMLRYAPLALL